MTELIFMKHDHTTTDATLTTVRTAKLFRPFDLIVAKPDNWGWGSEELTNPWFRIIRWSSISLDAVQEFLTPLDPVLDANNVATTTWQRRAKNINLGDVRIPNALKTWWLDNTRATPIFVVPNAFSVTPAQLRNVRSAIADPDYHP